VEPGAASRPEILPNLQPDEWAPCCPGCRGP